MASNRLAVLGFGAAAVAGGFVLASGCLPSTPVSLERQTDDDAGVDVILLETGSPVDAKYELPPADPHALLGVDPPHGPFSGGQSRLVRGNGFTSKVRVWFGGTEIPAGDVTPIDPNRVQVIAPPGAPGPADVTTQIDSDTSTARTLAGAYLYDAFYADPASGPTSGGTVIQFHGQSTAWDAGTTVSIGGQPCVSVAVTSPTDLTCTAAKSTAGAKSVTITRSDTSATTVLDAFTYADSDNGFKGGLSGGPLASQLKVLVYDNYSGDPIPGATVVAGDTLATALSKKTDGAGVALFQDPALAPRRSVTIVAKCHQPTTFVNVPVDTVTAYLDPIMSPDCGSGGDPPSVGGHMGSMATVKGELVWKGGLEFKRAPWNVPSPIGPDEQQTAYVFYLAGDPTQPFALPDASYAVTPSSLGSAGYDFEASVPPGNLALYALAGIENRKVSPTQFTAYAMGVVQGIATKPGKTTGDVYITMDATVDHAITLSVSAPVPGPRGPDRVRSSVAISIGNDGYALLPAGQKTNLVPITQDLSFVGFPALAGSLATSQYISTAKAGTGPSMSNPLSVLGKIATTDSSQIVPMKDFVQVPQLKSPGVNGAWDGQHLEVQFAPGGAPVDLVFFDIQSGGGLVGWQIAVPAGVTSVTLPDLAAVNPDGALLPGPVDISVCAAHIANFDYGHLLYRQLAPRGWDAYAQDDFPAHLGP